MLEHFLNLFSSISTGDDTVSGKQGFGSLGSSGNPHVLGGAFSDHFRSFFGPFSVVFGRSLAAHVSSAAPKQKAFDRVGPVWSP